MSLKRIQAQQAENLRLRQQLDTARTKLEKIASFTQTTKLLWWQIEARKALAAIGEAQPAKACAHFVRRIKMDGEKHLLVCADCGNVQEIGQPTAQSEFGAQPASFDVAKSIHYPECWDTACYPTIADAIREIAAFRCTNDDCAQPASAEVKPVQHPAAWEASFADMRRVFISKADADEFAFPGTPVRPLVYGDTNPLPTQQSRHGYSIIDEIQWRNIRHVVKALADWAFGSKDDQRWGTAWLAMVTGLTAKDGPEFQLEPLPQPRQESEIAAEALEEVAREAQRNGNDILAMQLFGKAAQKREAGK